MAILLIGYDDIYSIQHFAGDNLRYWNREGQWLVFLVQKAEKNTRHK